MEELSLGFIGAAFFAGLLTFLAPCTFPLLPAYLTIIAGGTLDEIGSTSSKSIRIKLLVNGLFYVIGFSLVFVTLGLFAGYIGSRFPGFRDAFRIAGGLLIIFFGLYMSGFIRLNMLDLTKRAKTDNLSKYNEQIRAFLLGFSVAFGWTPCVGPLLGSILTLATNTATAGQGAILLIVFSIGLGLPFMLFAFAAGAATRYVKKISKYTGVIQKVGGILLIIIGMMLLFNKFYLFIQYGFEIFKVFGYERLLQYL